MKHVYYVYFVYCVYYVVREYTPSLQVHIRVHDRVWCVPTDQTRATCILFVVLVNLAKAFRSNFHRFQPITPEVIINTRISRSEVPALGTIACRWTRCRPTRIFEFVLRHNRSSVCFKQHAVYLLRRSVKCRALFENHMNAIYWFLIKKKTTTTSIKHGISLLNAHAYHFTW